MTVRFSQARDPSEALKAAMQAICETERWEAARYVYVDEARGVLRAGESWSIPDPARERYLRESLAVEYAPGVGLVGHVWQTGEPLWVPDIGNDPRVARPQLAAVTGMRGSVVFPVHADGKTIGVLVFDSREVRKPDERLLRTLAVIGGQIGQLMRRAQAEQALAARERRFRALVEHGHDAILLYDRELRMIYRSPTAKGISGYEDEERLGGSLMDLVFEEDRPSLQSIVDQLRAERGGAAPFRCRVLHKNGRLRWIEGVFTNLLDEPAVGALVVNYRDIDEQMRAREALERSERYFRSLIESSGDIIAVADLDWRFTYMNPGLTRILGYDPRHAIGRLFLDYTPCDADALRAEVALALEQPGAAHVMQNEARHRDGSTRTLETTIVRSVDAANMPVYLINSRDLSERRRAEARLRKMVEATAAPLLLVDPGGAIVFANPAAAALFGRPAAALQGSPLGLPVNDGACGRGADSAARRRAARRRDAVRRGRTRRARRAGGVAARPHRAQALREPHRAPRRATTRSPGCRTARCCATASSRRSCTRGAPAAASAVMFVDLDQFKLVNDSLRPRRRATRCCARSAPRLRSAVREGDTVARLGGDEFVVLLADLARPGDERAGGAQDRRRARARRSCSTAARLLRHREHRHRHLPGRRRRRSRRCCKCADAAMYRAKDAGPRRLPVLQRATMGAQARARVELESGAAPRARARRAAPALPAAGRPRRPARCAAARR